MPPVYAATVPRPRGAPNETVLDVGCGSVETTLLFPAMRFSTVVPVVLATAFTLATTANAAKTPPPIVVQPYAMVVRVLDDNAGKYQVEIDNSNPTRFVSSFDWTPPSGMHVTAVTGSIGGTCNLTSDNIIVCKGLAAPPKSATGMGGAIIVNFTATGRQPQWAGSYWIHYGVVGSVQVQTSTFSDLPVCKKGQKNTAAHPCANI